VADPGSTGPSNKELKLTKREHNEASQLKSSVRRTYPIGREARVHGAMHARE